MCTSLNLSRKAGYWVHEVEDTYESTIATVIAPHLGFYHGAIATFYEAVPYRRHYTSIVDTL